MFPFTNTDANSRHNLARNKNGSPRTSSLSHFKISMLPLPAIITYNHSPDTCTNRTNSVLREKTLKHQWDNTGFGQERNISGNSREQASNTQMTQDPFPLQWGKQASLFHTRTDPPTLCKKVQNNRQFFRSDFKKPKIFFIRKPSY